MPNPITLLSVCVVLAIPAFASAQSASSTLQQAQQADFSVVDLALYADAPWDRPTNVAVSFLTALGIVHGNADQTFRPARTLNRAEFLSIVLAAARDAHTPASTPDAACFPDVRTEDWFAVPVCIAKARGIIRGYPDGLFHPARAVQYAEAAKMIVNAFALPMPAETDTWYARYMGALEHFGLSLAALQPESALTRGEMARLTAAVIAFRADRLEEYRDAEHARSARSSVSSVSPVPSVSSASSVPSVSSVSSRSSSSVGVTRVHSDILLLGMLSPPLAGVQYFSSLEPVDTDALTITLAEAVPSVSAVLVYDEDGALLGTASRIGDAASYRLTLASGVFGIPQNEVRRLYVRARMAAADAGGGSGERVQVETIRLEATGEWSDTAYTIASTDTFPVFETALARITSVINAGTTEALLGPGEDVMIGSFAFAGEEVAPFGDLRIASLSFDLSASAHFTVSDVRLGIAGSNERAPCVATSTRIECANLPVSIGTVVSDQSIRVYADVSVEPLAGNRSLRLTLDEPGYPDQPGDVTWSDGTTTFTWIGVDRPLAEGTVWR